MLRLILTFLVAGLLGLFIQSSVIRSSFPAAPVPDFLLILVIAVSRHFHTPLGAVGAFALGLLADFGSAQYLGPNAAGSVVAFYIVGLIANRVYADRAPALFIITFLCSLAKSAIAILFFELYLKDFVLPAGSLRIVLYEALFSGLLAPIVLRLLRVRVSPSSMSTNKMQSSPLFRRA